MLLFEQVTLFLFSLSGYLLNSCKLLAPTQSCGKKFHKSTQNKTTILAEAFRVMSRTGDKVFQLFFMVPYPASKTFSLWSATALDFFSTDLVPSQLLLILVLAAVNNCTERGALPLSFSFFVFRLFLHVANAI